MTCPECGKHLRGYVYELELTDDGIAAVPACPYCGARLK